VDARSFLELDARSAEELVVGLGGRPFHAKVVRRELFANGALEYGGMTGLSKELRTRLADALPLLGGREVTRSRSDDATTKLLVELARGGRVETVHMPSRRRGKGATLCVSTQVGCPVACPFCASGADGLERNLEADEIVEQFVRGAALGPLSRAVVMGMGEPLLNYDNLCRALETVRDELGLGARSITVSTVGFPERLARAARSDPRFQLAISLHSPFDEQRAELVPAMARVPVADVLAAGDDWFAVTGREVTYEYVLLAGTNDGAEHASALAEQLAGRRATVNLIPFNPVGDPGGDPGGGRPGDGSVGPGGYRRPSAKAAERFQRGLSAAGVVATVRWSRGVETDAACGQLRARKADSPAVGGGGATGA